MSTENDTAPAAGTQQQDGAAQQTATEAAAAAAAQQQQKNGQDKHAQQQERAPVSTIIGDDWREKIAGEDAKLLDSLKRYQSHDNWVAAQRTLARQITTGEFKRAINDASKPEDIADFRKSWGIPDEPSGYGVSFPDEIGASEADKADLGEFLSSMHAAHATPSVVKTAVETYIAIKQKTDEQLREAALQATIDQKAELKAEFGKDYNRNVTLAKRGLQDMVGEEAAAKITDTVLATGTRLGDDPSFVRFVVAASLRLAEDSALASSEFNSSAGTLEDQYNAALDLKFSDPGKYHSDAHQTLLAKLAGAKAARAANGSKAA